MKSCAHIVVGAMIISSVAVADDPQPVPDVLTDAIWTGLGSDDRWSNPDNWAGGQLPTLSSRVIEDPTFNWGQSWPHSRQITVTIDSSAEAGEWTTEHFTDPQGVPFTHVRIVPGANFQAGSESLDQDTFESPNPSYVQSGGVHTVDEFLYLSGEFRMEGGTFIANKIIATPDLGSFSFLGGLTQVARLEVPTINDGFLFRIGGSADVHVTEYFSFSANLFNMATTFERPLYMDGADFKVESVFDDPTPFGDAEPFNDMHLIFGGNGSDVGLLEVSSIDRGADDPAGWTKNAMIGTIEIGDDQPAHIRLVNDFANWYEWDSGGAADAQYVDTLRIHSGSVLDLNGINLYVRVLDDLGGTFMNGQPIVVPEPAALVWLIGAVMAIRRRRGGPEWRPRRRCR